MEETKSPPHFWDAQRAEGVLERIEQLERKLDYLYAQRSAILGILSRSGMSFDITPACLDVDPFLEEKKSTIDEWAASARETRAQREERRKNRPKVFRSEPEPA